MKRKNWVSIVCGGFLLVAVAVPAGATGWDFVQPRPAVFELVMDWLGGWLPGSAVESRVEAGKKDRGGPDGQSVGSTCTECETDGNGGYIDPDG